ncbi:MAG TPA: hypothetical protein VE693_12955 [Gaiellaceae bacterium]|nr:hypothetical protein [Gaiellaceae bacterium]
MPQSNSSRRLVLRLVLFTLAGSLLWAIRRTTAKPGENVTTTDSEAPASARARAKTGGFNKRRLATTLAFTTLFFAGAAFSAGAGDLVVGAVEGSSDATATSTETAPDESSDPAPADDQSASDEAPPADPAPAPAPEPAPSGDDQAADTGSSDDGQPADSQPADSQPADDQASGDQAAGDDGGSADDGSADAGEPGSDPAPADGGDSSGADTGQAPDGSDAAPGSSAHAGDSQPPAPPAPESQPGANGSLVAASDAPSDLEFDGNEYGVLWFHRTLADPTPPSKRLAPAFARKLVRVSRANHVEWAFVLAVLRAEGHRARTPASGRDLQRLAAQLHRLRADRSEWSAALALKGRTAFADRVQALTRYNRAAGLRALVRGLEAEKGALERRVLNDPRLNIYVGGRDDVIHHRINVRVLVLMLYMAECHGEVTVSSLDSGHRLYARPGVISAHKFGLAVDFAALGGVSILGHQQPGGLTEQAVRNILLLPSELQPKQVISLLGLGGPSFPLADHYDHIHVGY